MKEGRERRDLLKQKGERGPAESSVSPYIVEGTSGRGFGKVWRINAGVGMFLGASAH